MVRESPRCRWQSAASSARGAGGHRAQENCGPIAGHVGWERGKRVAAGAALSDGTGPPLSLHDRPLGRVGKRCLGRSDNKTRHRMQPDALLAHTDVVPQRA